MSSTALFYIDDSGTKDLIDITCKLFCYCGVFIDVQLVPAVEAGLLALKQAFFGTDVELKSHSLRRPELRKKHFTDPLKITDAKLSVFTSRFYAWLRQQPLVAFGVVIDKEKLQRKYTNPFNPSSVAYEYLLQRLANHCTATSTTHVSVVFDDMTGKTPKGSEWKKLLVRQHGTLLAGKSPSYRGWTTRQGMDYSSIDPKLVFHDSAKSQGIQIADLCAYNIFRQARDNWGNLDAPPFYRSYSDIYPIIAKDKSGLAAGFGVVNYP